MLSSQGGVWFACSTRTRCWSCLRRDLITKQIALLQSLLEDANSRKNELETENRSHTYTHTHTLEQAHTSHRNVQRFWRCLSASDSHAAHPCVGSVIWYRLERGGTHGMTWTVCMCVCVCVLGWSIRGCWRVSLRWRSCRILFRNTDPKQMMWVQRLSHCSRAVDLNVIEITAHHRSSETQIHTRIHMHSRIHTHAYTHTHTHVYTHTHTHVYTHTHTHAFTYTHTRLHTHTHTHTHVYTHTHTHVYTHTHTHVYTHIHTHTLSLVCTHTHTHTHSLSLVRTHTHIQQRLLMSRKIISRSSEHRCLFVHLQECDHSICSSPAPGSLTHVHMIWDTHKLFSHVCIGL